MHNRIGFNRLGRKSSHRKALIRNMVNSLMKYERIKTTQAKAKAIRGTAEKLVTRAKQDSVHNRRIVAKSIYEKDVIDKLFTEIGPRFVNRPGGYTRILKVKRRSGDAAEMVILELLNETQEDSNTKKKSSEKKDSSKVKEKPSSDMKPAIEEGTQAEIPASIETKAENAEEIAQESNPHVSAEETESEEVVKEDG